MTPPPHVLENECDMFCFILLLLFVFVLPLFKTFLCNIIKYALIGAFSCLEFCRNDFVFIK